ncbi:hypothetical protein PHLCEN_2v5167 [Hermanssonia centrifuga]|uniref:Uncharacterized protein n=1 Tax=Hermanssonia centrifuga TaxID=98765 RepID=A0A2R6P8R8_9APHY|nr:hypothetical protein PHLCEN_2v5167 [Hermanssonia centrifuga]
MATDGSKLAQTSNRAERKYPSSFRNGRRLYLVECDPHEIGYTRLSWQWSRRANSKEEVQKNGKGDPWGRQEDSSATREPGSTVEDVDADPRLQKRRYILRNQDVPP